jgi:hypothetical protein
MERLFKTLANHTWLPVPQRQTHLRILRKPVSFVQFSKMQILCRREPLACLFKMNRSLLCYVGLRPIHLFYIAHPRSKVFQSYRPNSLC